MSAHEKAQEAALNALVAVLDDSNVRTEIRVEAAKTILNRPRFFINQDVKEA